MLSKFFETAFDRIGDWNPQLLRELKGRWKILPILLAIGLSLCGQMILWAGTASDNMPGKEYQYQGSYCELRQENEQKFKQLNAEYQQLQDQFFRVSSKENFDAVKVQELRSKIETVKSERSQIEVFSVSNKICPSDRINWQKWKQDNYQNIFIRLSTIGLFALIIGGGYLISHDIIKEKQRGTLNFVRMSPQSAASILIGKLIGVPILVYIFVSLAIPFQVYSSQAAQISGLSLLTFDTVSIAAVLCFYCLSLMLSLSDRSFKSILPWFSSGLLFIFLSCSWYWAGNQSSDVRGTAGMWGLLLSPFCHLQYLTHHATHHANEFDYAKDYFLYKFKVFGIEAGTHQAGLALVMLSSYILWIYWLWKASIRSFQMPDAPLLTKSQSYLAVCCYEIGLLAFTTIPDDAVSVYVLTSKLGWLAMGNVVLFAVLILGMTPDRQTVQDWSRFRHQLMSSQLVPHAKSLKADLLQGEKSPAILAIALNLAIAAIPLLLMACVPLTSKSLPYGFSSIELQLQHGLMVLLFLTTIAIAAALAQLILMQKSSKRFGFAFVAIGSVFFLFPIAFSLFSLGAVEHGGWLISIFPWQVLTDATMSEILTACLFEWLVLGTLLWQLRRQLKLVGQSDSKVLLDRP